MFQQNKFLTILILLLLSVIFFYVSYYGGKVQELYTGEFNSFQTFFFKVSNYSSALMPLLVFMFIYITDYFMFMFLDIEKHKTSLSEIIATAFIPIIIYSTLYLLLLVNFTDNAVSINGDIRKVKLFYNLTFEDFKNIGLIFWCLFYLILIIQTKIKYETEYYKSAIINLVPSFIVIVIKLFM